MYCNCRQIFFSEELDYLLWKVIKFKLFHPLYVSSVNYINMNILLTFEVKFYNFLLKIESVFYIILITFYFNTRSSAEKKSTQHTMKEVLKHH